jgi:hypothetical protein
MHTSPVFDVASATTCVSHSAHLDEQVQHMSLPCDDPSNETVFSPSTFRAACLSLAEAYRLADIESRWTPTRQSHVARSHMQANFRPMMDIY